MFDSEYKNELSDENGMGIIPHMLKFGKTTNLKEFSDFPIISGKIPENLEVWFSECKVISVTKIKRKWCLTCWNWQKITISKNLTEWEKYPIYWNLPKLVNFWEFLYFQVPIKIWKSEFKIKVSDLNWVGKYPISWHWPKLANLQEFPDFQFPDSRKVGNLKFWVKNQE